MPSSNERRSPRLGEPLVDAGELRGGLVAGERGEGVARGGELGAAARAIAARFDEGCAEPLVRLGDEDRRAASRVYGGGALEGRDRLAGAAGEDETAALTEQWIEEVEGRLAGEALE